MSATMSPLAIVIIAAGKGTRMKSARAKVLHHLAGRPLIMYTLELAQCLQPQRLITVVGYQAEVVRGLCERQGAACTLQEPQLGTGHAVAQAESLLRDFTGNVLILYGDVPLLQPDTVRRLCQEHEQQQATVTVLTAVSPEPHGYGRIVRDAQGRIQRIVEERDASASERAICEVNSGIYCIRTPFLFTALQQVGRANAQGEQYLTDVVAIAVAEQHTVAHVGVLEMQEMMGVNTRLDLARLEALMRRQICETWMRAGVTLVDATTTVIDASVRIGQDTVVAPQTHLLGHSSIGAGCRIGPQVVIQDSTLGDGVQVEPFCLIRHHAVLPGTRVAAFSNLTAS